MMIMSAPRPVSTPPTEVAMRQPCAVVSNSGTACRCADNRVGKICRYQSLATIRRQSRDNLSASSWAWLTQRICALGLHPRHQAGKATEARCDCGFGTRYIYGCGLEAGLNVHSRRSRWPPDFPKVTHTDSPPAHWRMIAGVDCLPSPIPWQRLGRVAKAAVCGAQVINAGRGIRPVSNATPAG